jgi:hypothetical protein
LIPKLEDNIPKLQKLLLEEERMLEEVVENSKGCKISFLIDLDTSKKMIFY